MLDVEAVREDFPILHQQVHERPLVYFDNAATSQKPAAVIEAVASYYREDNANVHRGSHTLSDRSTRAYEEARETARDFIGAADTEEIVFVRNTSEALNIVAHSWAMERLEEGDEILLTAMEHHSNLIPWQMAARRTGAELRFAELTPEGRLDEASFDEALSSRTQIVAFPHASNVLGTIVPAKQLIRKAHDAGAVAVVDGAQSVPHRPVDVRDLDCDFLAFSGHKMCGPTGIGVLYGKRGLLDAMPPFLGGGEMIGRVQRTKASWADLPHKFEAGTPSIAQAVGLKAAMDYLDGLGMEAVRAHEEDLIAYALDRVDGVKGMSVHGPPDGRGAVMSFTLEGIHPHDVSQVLDRHGVAIRAGHHCTQPLMNWLGEPATARASFYLYNTKDELEPFLEGIREAKEFFGVVSV